MLANKYIYILLLISIFSNSCIKEYQAKIDDSEVGKYVISGKVTNNEGYHYVEISKTTDLIEPEFELVSNCQLKFIDGENNEFDLSEYEEGKYRAYLNSSDLEIGKIFKLYVKCPDGTEIESDYDTILNGPEMGNIHFELDSLKIEGTQTYKPGAQYYVDLDAEEYHPKYYKWDLVETYEYRVPYPIEWWYDGTLHRTWPPDSTKMVCWKTEKIKEIFVLSTDNLSSNNYQNYKLHFVSNQSERLMHLYSVQIFQQAITAKTYYYWQQMYENSNRSGGLYNSQPFIVSGNLHNLTNPDEEVLGYFYTANERIERIFTYPFAGLSFNFSGCSFRTLRFGVRDIPFTQYPGYLLSNNDGTYANSLMSLRCVNCLRQGGTNIKPDFWPEE